MNDSNEIQPDERLEKRTRRRFSAAEKKRLLAEADSLPRGEKGLWLRRNGLYAGQLSTWRRELAEHSEAGLAGKAPGRKPADPRDREIERLRRANAKLERRTEVAEQLIDLQKKYSKWRTTPNLRTNREPAVGPFRGGGGGAKTRACQALGVPRHWCYPDQRQLAPRPRTGGTQPRQLTPAQQAETLATLLSERIQDQASRQVYGALLSEGIKLASVSTKFPLLRTDGESRPRRAQRPPQKYIRPRLTARASNECWLWDITKNDGLDRVKTKNAVGTHSVEVAQCFGLNGDNKKWD